MYSLKRIYFLKSQQRSILFRTQFLWTRVSANGERYIARVASEFKESWRRPLNQDIFTLIRKAIDPALRLSEAAGNQEISISSLLSSSLLSLEAAKPGIRKPGLRSGGWSDESPYKSVISVGIEVWWRHLRQGDPQRFSLSVSLL